MILSSAAHGLTLLALFSPFVAARTLPDMRRALASKKELADLVEALLGVVCEAQRETDQPGETAGAPLSRSLAAALAFFQTFVHPTGSVAAGVEDAAAFLRGTM